MQYSLIVFEILTDFATVFTKETIKPDFIEGLLCKSVNWLESRLFTAERALHSRCIPVPLVQTSFAKCSFTFGTFSRL